MKTAGFPAIALLCCLLILSGCVQITVNVPPLPGTANPAPSPSATHPAGADTPPPAAHEAPVKTAGSQTTAPAQKFIVPVGDVSRTGHRTFTFNYAPYSGPHEYTIRVPVNMSVYYGARQMQVTLPPNPDSSEINAFISSYGHDPAMEELYTDILSQLRNARYQNGGYLTDDEYFDMIVAFVQQIPYVQNPSPKRKYPIEVIYDKAGDADEKGQLLAKLLAREGYDVALLVFEDLGYETVGIRVNDEIPDASLKVFSDGKKDYVFIDAGQSRFIGSIPAAFQSSDEPVIFPVGSGTKSYSSINYVWKIVADLNHMVSLKKIDRTTVINTWDKFGTCSWIKNSKLLLNTTCYCCDI